MTTFSTISLDLTKLYVTQSFAIASVRHQSQCGQATCRDKMAVDNRNENLINASSAYAIKWVGWVAGVSGLSGSWDAAPLPVENIHRLAINLYSELLIRSVIFHTVHAHCAVCKSFLRVKTYFLLHSVNYSMSHIFCCRKVDQIGGILFLVPKFSP